VGTEIHTSRVAMGKSGVPSFLAAILVTLEVTGLLVMVCGVSIAREIGTTEALDAMRDLKCLRSGIVEDTSSQLGTGGFAVFIQAYG
jgi:hypothetical protein